MSKKWLFVALASLISVASFADEVEEPKEQEEVVPEYVPKIYEENMKDYLTDKNAHLTRHIHWNSTEIVLLSDDSVWMVHPLEVRFPGWWDRLRGNKIVQPTERFLSVPKEWKEDSDVKIYCYSWKQSGLSEIYDFDTTRLIYCTHIIENVATGEQVFARPLKNNHIVQLFNSWIQDVYGKGFIEGYEKGSKDANNKKM